MGQRLNIEIKRKEDNKVLANCYYHWSAYTRESLQLAKEIINNVYDVIEVDRNKVNDKIKAIQLLQTTGAGVEEQDYEKLEETDQKYCNIGVDRNLGLISFTEENMEDTRRYEEGRLTITIDFKNNKDHLFNKNGIVDFEVYSIADDEYLEECYKEEIESGEINLDNAVKFKFDVHNMTLEDINTFLRLYDDVVESNGFFRDKNNNLYQMIY